MLTLQGNFCKWHLLMPKFFCLDILKCIMIQQKISYFHLNFELWNYVLLLINIHLISYHSPNIALLCFIQRLKSIIGSTPYPGMGAREVMRRVRDGYRLERPSHCHPELYKIISKCWAGDMNKRPDFTELRQVL